MIRVGTRPVTFEASRSMSAWSTSARVRPFGIDWGMGGHPGVQRWPCTRSLLVAVLAGRYPAAAAAASDVNVTRFVPVIRAALAQVVRWYTG
jgi:hypothetical protein